MRPERFAAGRQARIQLRPGLRIGQAAVHPASGLGLRFRETGWRRLIAGAHQRARIERAAPWIVDHAVGDPVTVVAGGERLAMQQAERRRRQVAGGIFQNREHAVEVSRHQPRPVVRRRAGDDAIVVRGKALGRHQAFVAARGAADEIRALGRPAVELLHEAPGLDRCLVVRAVREVDELFGLLEREPGHVQPRRRFVACVGRRGRVAAPELIPHGAEGDGARPSAVADAGELAVPLLERHPHLEEDV